MGLLDVLLRALGISITRSAQARRFSAPPTKARAARSLQSASSPTSSLGKTWSDACLDIDLEHSFMQRTLLALSCALILAGGSAFAQQQSSGLGSAATNDTAGASITDKAKQAAQTIGEKAKEAAGKVKDMVQETAQKSKAAADQKTAQAGDGPSSKSQQMQKRADAEFKSAKAKCAAIQRQVQKTVCEKQAAVTHANAELRIAKANAAAQGGNTSAMGAGKSAQ